MNVPTRTTGSTIRCCPATPPGGAAVVRTSVVRIDTAGPLPDPLLTH